MGNYDENLGNVLATVTAPLKPHTQSKSPQFLSVVIKGGWGWQIT